MSEVQLTVSQGQRELLVRMLGDVLKHKRVEVHRTEFSREFRQDLEAEVAQIEDLLDKLTRTVAVG